MFCFVPGDVPGDADFVHLLHGGLFFEIKPIQLLGINAKYFENPVVAGCDEPVIVGDIHGCYVAGVFAI